MKKYTISVPDNKADLFLGLMKSISFVKSINEDYSQEVPEEHKTEVRERIEKYKNNPEAYLEWDDIEKKMKLDK